jgi:hypothetical protein
MYVINATSKQRNYRITFPHAKASVSETQKRNSLYNCTVQNIKWIGLQGYFLSLILLKYCAVEQVDHINTQCIR